MFSIESDDCTLGRYNKLFEDDEEDRKNRKN